MTHTVTDAEIAPAWGKQNLTLLWSLSAFAAVLLVAPAIGVGTLLAQIPHTNRGCTADDGPICGDQAFLLQLSAVSALILLSLYAYGMLILKVGSGEQGSWKPVLSAGLAVLGCALLVLAIAYAVELNRPPAVLPPGL